MNEDKQVTGAVAGWLVECQQVREQVGQLDRSVGGRLIVSGGDRFTWLQGMVSNDVRPLESGAVVVYACILNATGHLLADLAMLNYGSELLLDMAHENRQRIHELLESFIITEDVEIRDESDTLTCISVQGPEAKRVPLRNESGAPILAVPADHTGEGGFDLYVGSGRAADIRDELIEAGIPLIGETASETLRIEAGIPKYGLDMDESTIPLEANLESTHISHTKGCYVGQEIIARIHSRGHTNRALTGFLVDGANLPERADKIVDDSRDVGWVTSAAYSPSLDRGIALGYLRHELREAGTNVQTAAGIALIVTELPFVRANSA